LDTRELLNSYNVNDISLINFEIIENEEDEDTSEGNSSPKNSGEKALDNLKNYLNDGLLNLGNMHRALESDLVLIDSWISRIPKDNLNIEVSPDRVRNPKLQFLLDILSNIAEECQNRPEVEIPNAKKVIIFTSSAKTAEWLRKEKDDMNRNGKSIDSSENIRVVTGNTSTNDRRDILYAFAPESMGFKEYKDNHRNQDILNDVTCDILISTDVLAEGVNLQQASRVIHYDLPWNPMRVVQRVGRIDRLGTKHKSIYNYCFFPQDEILNEYLKIEDTLRMKMSKARRSIGTSDPLQLPGTATIGRGTPGNVGGLITSALLIEEIDTLFDPKPKPGQSEEGRRRLLDGLKNEKFMNGELFKTLPYKAGTIFTGWEQWQQGWVFCFKIMKDKELNNSYIRFISVQGIDEMKLDEECTSWRALVLGDPYKPGTDELANYEDGEIPQDSNLFLAHDKAVQQIVKKINEESTNHAKKGIEQTGLIDQSNLSLINWMEIRPPIKIFNKVSNVIRMKIKYMHY